MRAWVVAVPGPVAGRPLRRRELPDPYPGAGEVRVAVTACGVCRTDLHVAEGDLPARRTGCRTGTTTYALRPCCVPASSVTGHCGWRTCHPVVGWGSTASAPRRT